MQNSDQADDDNKNKMCFYVLIVTQTINIKHLGNIRKIYNFI